VRSKTRIILKARMICSVDLIGLKPNEWVFSSSIYPEPCGETPSLDGNTGIDRELPGHGRWNIVSGVQWDP
jgi:hypothetical protein